MKRLIALAAAAMFAFPVFGRPSARVCEDHSRFVQMAANARDNNVAEKLVEDAVRQIVINHPELGVGQYELEDMMKAIRLVYEHTELSPEGLRLQYLSDCAGERHI